VSRTVTLLQDLKQFHGPDTSAPSVGTLAVGTYPVEATTTKGTDEYVQLGTWICSKSNGVTYATINDPQPPITNGISEAALTSMLQKFQGYSYSGPDPRYTSAIPNVSGLPLAPPKQDDCCVFAEDLIVHAFQNASWAFTWSPQRHGQMMITDIKNLWSPPMAISQSGLGLTTVGPTQSQPLPQPWSMAQGWGPASGHSFIVVATHSATRKVLILESNVPKGGPTSFSGPGLRGLGDLDNYLASGPPANWYEYPGVPTWEQMHGYYTTGIAYAQLKVLTSTLVWGKSS
jgi:hypothetical protein